MALQIPMFHTHHAPVGAWASLTFGSPSKGVSIDLENPEVKDSGTLLFGMANGQEVHTIGFTERQKTEGDATGDRERPPMKGAFRDYGLYGQEEIVRTLTPSLDRYEAGNLCLTVYTPCQGLPDPEKGEIPSDMCLPGVLMDLTVDNRTGERPCTAFFGLAYPAPKKIAAVDTANMCGFGYKGSWAFAAEKEEDIFLVQGGGALGHLKEGKASIHQNGPLLLGFMYQQGKNGHCLSSGQYMRQKAATAICIPGITIADTLGMFLKQRRACWHVGNKYAKGVRRPTGRLWTGWIIRMLPICSCFARP